MVQKPILWNLLKGENVFEFNMLEDLPQIYQIEITEKCNLQCPMCPNHTMETHDEATKELIDMVVDNNYLRNTVYTEFQMSGEPTLAKTLPYAVDRVKSTGTMVGLSTNLTTVQQKIDVLKELDCITVSFDIFDKDLFEQSRFPYKFEKFLENLDFLINNVYSSTMIQVQTLKTVWTAPKFDESRKKMTDYFEKKYSASNIIFRETEDSFIDKHEQGDKPLNNEMCLNPFQTVSVKADGTIVPCSLDFFKEIPLGNLFEESMAQIWGGDRMKRLRQQHRTGSSLPLKCEGCYNRSPITYMNHEIINKLIEHKLNIKGYDCD